MDPSHDTLPPEAANPNEPALRPLTEALAPAARRLRDLLARLRPHR
jgi:hypothetical protein